MRENKIGMSLIISHPDKTDIKEQISLFARTGFDSFFLSSGVTNDFEKIYSWKEEAVRCGIEFEAVHAPANGVDGIWTGSEDGNIYVNKIKQIIDICSKNKISKMVIHTGISPQMPVSHCGLIRWKELEMYSAERNVIMCYENSGVPEHFKAVVEKADKFHGICHDVGHQNCYTPHIRYEKIYGNRIMYTHIHDNIGVRRRGRSCDLHLLPEDGTIGWKEYMKSLSKISYSGTLNLELSCMHSQKYREMKYCEFVNMAYERIIKIKGDL